MEDLVEEPEGEQVACRKFEFKFSKITQQSVPVYCKLIDAVLDSPAARMTILVVNREKESFSPGGELTSTWSAYLNYADLLIENAVLASGKNRRNPPNQVIVLADYLSRPNESVETLETRLARHSQIQAVITLESHASLLIQAVDVFTGAVVFDFRKQSGTSRKHDKDKELVVRHLRQRVEKTSLAGNLVRNDLPGYFSVWDLHPINIKKGGPSGETPTPAT